jgi:hypothetical protein
VGVRTPDVPNVLLALPLLVSLWAGCLAPPADCSGPVGAGVWVPQLAGAFLMHGAGSAWQTVALPHAAHAEATTLTVNGSSTIAPVAPGAALQLVEVPSGVEAAHLDWTVREADPSDPSCRTGQSGRVDWPLTAAGPGAIASAGKGVQVWYAGFWENGTLFDTNIQALDQSGWPRAAWYGSEPYQPLPVYVYDQERSEKSPLCAQVPDAPCAPWTVGTAGTAAGPATGNATLWSYSTTVKGFNDGLKGLSTTTTRVVRMEAKDAYGGRTDVPAGLDAPLVFLVKIAAVEDVPCAAQPTTCPFPDPAVAPGVAFGRASPAAPLPLPAGAHTAK